MAFKVGEDSSGIRELKLGKSFDRGRKDEAYHTIRYDFKPASVSAQKAGNLEIADKEVTLTVPLAASSGIAQEAVFKGNKTSASKDCLLIIDNTTGEIVLEKISENIRVKKTRAEGSSKKAIHSLAPDSRKPATVTNTSNGSSQLSSSNQPKNNKSSGNKMLNSMPLLSLDEEKNDHQKSDSSSESESNSDSSSSSSDSESDSGSREVKSNKNIDSSKDRLEINKTTTNNHESSILSDLELSEED